MSTTELTCELPPAYKTMVPRPANHDLAGRRVFTRADIDQSWSRIVMRVLRHEFPCVSPVRLLSMLWLEIQITAMFAYAFLQSRNKKPGLDA
jgi:hypothetical protein